MNPGRRPVAALAAVVACLGAALGGCSPGSNDAASELPAASPSSVAAASVLPAVGSVSAVLPSSPPVVANFSDGAPGPASVLPSSLRSAGLEEGSPSPLAAGVAAGGAPAPQPPRADPPRPAAADPQPALPAAAYVDVSVATLWHSPSSPRGVDAVALTRPVGLRSWLAAMSLDQRRALNGRVDSQLLLGERVIVDREQGAWAHVVVPDQPTPLDPAGYPGWIPLLQLTFRAPTKAAQEATVVSPTAWLYAGSARYYEV